MELPHTVWVYLVMNLLPIGCIGRSPGNGIRMTHHRHCILHVISYTNPLEYTNEYVKALLLPHWLGECNEVVICIKYRYLLRHHVFEDIRDGLIFCHEPNLLT